MSPNPFFPGRPERCRAMREKKELEGSREAREESLIMHGVEDAKVQTERRDEAEALLRRKTPEEKELHLEVEEGTCAQ